MVWIMNYDVIAVKVTSIFDVIKADNKASHTVRPLGTGRFECIVSSKCVDIPLLRSDCITNLLLYRPWYSYMILICIYFVVKFVGIHCWVFNLSSLLFPPFSEYCCWKDGSHKFRTNLPQNEEVLSKFYHHFGWTWKINFFGKSGPMAQVNFSPFQHRLKNGPYPAKSTMLHKYGSTLDQFLLEKSFIYLI